RDLSFVLRLLESVRFELPSGLEEECLRWRQNRLLDLGIWPREERLLFFAPLTFQQFKSALKPRDPSEPKNKLPLIVKSDLSDRYPFLKQALLSCSDEFKDNFWQSLSSATV